MMHPLLESAITGALVGAILLGASGTWLGVGIMVLTSWWSSWVSWSDILRITLIFGVKGAVIGLITGLVVGVFTSIAFHLLIGAVTGSLCAIFLGVKIAFGDTSSRSVQINRAIANGLWGLLVGPVVGGILGWLLGIAWRFLN